MSKEKRNIESLALQRFTYKKTNAYSLDPSFQQILTIALFLIQIIMHSVFIASAISKQESPILWVILAITYCLFAFIVRDYLYLTCTDPVDDLILGIPKGYRQSQVKRCNQGCGKIVHQSSYHCHTCRRCVQYFDHHCKYLNNCIGGKNYHVFFRLLVLVTAFCLIILGSSIWIFLIAQNDQAYNERILSKWGAIATLIYTIVMVISVDTLLCFHCYLIFVLKKTTLQYLDQKTDDNVDSSKQAIDT